MLFVPAELRAEFDTIDAALRHYDSGSGAIVIADTAIEALARIAASPTSTWHLALPQYSDPTMAGLLERTPAGTWRPWWLYTSRISGNRALMQSVVDGLNELPGRVHDKSPRWALVQYEPPPPPQPVDPPRATAKR